MSLPLLLFQAEVGGATYWVSALHAEHARELLYVYEEEMGSDAEDVEDAKITPLSQEKAEKLTFKVDDPADPEETRTMWAEQEGS